MKRDIGRYGWFVGIAAALMPLALCPLSTTTAQDPSPATKSVPERNLLFDERETRSLSLFGGRGEPLIVRSIQNYDDAVRTLLKTYGESEVDSERTKTAEELTQVVGQQFDLRQKSREAELNQLEEKLRKLRGIHARREQERDTIIRARVQQLLREQDGLGWGEDAGAHDPFGRPNAAVKSVLLRS